MAELIVPEADRLTPPGYESNSVICLEEGCTGDVVLVKEVPGPARRAR